MDEKEFLDYDGFQVIFPDYQDADLRNFAEKIQSNFRPDATIVRKSTYDRKKRYLKDKDVAYIEFLPSFRGLLGLFLCIIKFEELIEIRVFKKLLKIDIPREIRSVLDVNFECFSSMLEASEMTGRKPIKIADIESPLRKSIFKILQKQEGCYND